MSVPPGNLVERQIPRPYLRPTDSEALQTENQQVNRKSMFSVVLIAINDDSLINWRKKDQEAVPTAPKSISRNDLCALNESGLEKHKATKTNTKEAMTQVFHHSLRSTVTSN